MVKKRRESEHKVLDSNWKLVEKHGLIIMKRQRQKALKRYKPMLEPADFEKAQKQAEKARAKRGEFGNYIRWKKGDE